MSQRLQAQPRVLSHRILLLTLIVMLVLAGVGISNSSAVKNTLSVITGNSEHAVSMKIPGGELTVHAAGRGKPYLNLRDGRSMGVNYKGDSGLTSALQSGAAQARSLASADFEGNGTPELLAGYAYNGAGMLALYRGNPDAFAPTDDSVFVRMQDGYNPDSFLPDAAVYPLPVSPDLLVTGTFTHDSEKDVLFAAKGGALYLMAGDGSGHLGAPQQINLPGPVTTLAAGEFRAADGFTDIAVGVSGPGGESLLIFDAAEGLSNALVQYQLSEPASAIEFGGLDDDPFIDVAVTAGSEILVVHGWGRKEQVVPASREERIPVAADLRGLALGEFTWDRQGRSEIAALSADGRVHIVQSATLNSRPFTQTEAAQRTRGNLKPQPRISQDIESAQSWQPGQAAGWNESSSFSATSFEGVSSASTKPLLRSNLSYRPTDDLMLMGASQPKLEIVSSTPVSSGKTQLSAQSAPTSTTLDMESAPVAVLALPRKLNGVTDVVVLEAASTTPGIIPNAPNTTITVDRTDDPSGAGLTAASACTAALNDCSLRGALQFANLPSNNNTTINLPANTYILSINGTNAGGCDGNTVGDLGANQTVTITGAGAATTIIRQTGTGPANDGDRVMCMNEVFATGLIYNFSGVSFVGGREGTAAGTGTVLGGAGIIGGELNNSLTLTNVVFANNQETVAGSNNLGGGGLQITGGNLIITNSTFGGSSAPGAYTDRTSTNTANLQTGNGGGLTYTPSSPQHTGGTGTLTITGSTFSRNTAAGIGGGGVDVLIFAFALPGGIGSGTASISTSTFSNNQGLGTASGGGVMVESLPTTVATSSFTNNSAGNRGGGIFVAGSSLLLNGTSPSITFTGNTATSGGSSVSTAAAVNVDGTNTTIGGDIQIGTGGTWTNNAGSTLAPTNVVVTGGTFNMNNSTMNVSGDLTISPAAIAGSTFNGNTGTVNIQGNFVLNAGGSPATTLNAGTGTFNFNGTNAQSITNGTNITFFNLTDSNVTNPLTLNNSLAVNGTLNVNGANAILSPVAGAVISGTGTLTGTGTARASRIAATADFLNQYTITNKTLTNLTIDYNGAGNQTVNNTPAYSKLRISGSGTKTLQGNTIITSNLDIIAGSTFAASTFNFALGGNWTNGGTFTPGTGTVTFQGNTGTQLLTGNTTFFNLTLNNTGATTNFGNTSTTIGNDLVASAGTMDGGTSTITFTGVTDNAGAISGAAAKNFFNLQINSPATITHNAGANITIENNYTNSGTFNQGAGLTTIFDVDNTADGAHTLSGAGLTNFGNVTINGSNTVDAGTHNLNVIGPAFSVAGTFTGNAGTVTFNGAAAQSITGDGAKNFAGLLINNANGVQVVNGTGAVDAFVGGLLTLNTDLTVVPGAVLQQGGTSTGVFDVLGTVRRTDLTTTPRSFGNVNNQVTIDTGAAPALDFNLVKSTPTGFPAGVKVVPRTYTLTPTGGGPFSATLRLRYIQNVTEITGPGITESRLVLWKDTTGSDNWQAQGGTADTVNDHVTHTGITSFSSSGLFSEWAIAEASDLTLSKANNVSGSAVVGQSWNWTLTATNTGSPATFTNGQTIISDNLPNSNITYGTPTVQNISNITGSANISCSIVSNDLTCVASGGDVTFASNIGASNFDVVFSATAQAAGSYQNPRAGGTAKIDPTGPNGVIAESNESNNSPTSNTVTVGKANTTTTINSDNPDPSVVGESVIVTWSVTVNAPGSLGAPLTGTVTVRDGATTMCSAPVGDGQCTITTFSTAGAKSLTAEYSGDTNYNGSTSTPATPHTVNKADTTTTITEDSPDTSTPGQMVTVKWTVTVNAPGAGTPGGTVSVTVSGGPEGCSNVLVGDGQCTFALNATGLRTITATYSGDPNFNGSSDTDDHTVCGDSVVTSTADSGPGSLRQIIADACPNSTIMFDTAGTFATPQTITALSTLVIAKNVTINGPGAAANKVTISGGGGNFNVFRVDSPVTTAAMSNLTITGANATGVNGGGLLVQSGTVTLTGMLFTGNTVINGDGGAIAAATGSTVNVFNSTISGNTAREGGGLVSTGGTINLLNVTITNNNANGNTGTGACPAAGSINGGGGGIKTNFNPTNVKNTILSFNTACSAAINASGAFTTESNNIFDVNPGLAALADNGGPTQTHALLSTSPAIEVGDNCVSTGTCASPFNGITLTTDQRGTNFPRTLDSADALLTQTVDIGAFELHPSISDIPNTPINENTNANIGFSIGDDNNTGALITSVTATSSNTTLVPNAPANLSVGGSAGTGLRNLQIMPASNQTGTTTITVTVTATNGRTATDTFDLTVNAVNDPPVANNDPYSTNEDTPLVVNAANGVLANDTDPDTPLSSLTAILVTGPANAQSFTLNPDGSFNYTPNTNFNGSDTFTYKANDGSLDSNVATVTITVNAINDAPTVAVNAGITVSEGSTNNTITNAMLRVDDVDNTAAQIVFTIGTAPVNGTLKKLGVGLAAGGTFTQDDINNNRITYDHNGSQTTSDSFTFTVSDGAGGTIGLTTFNITITGVNNAPTITAGGTLNYTENDPATVIDNTITVNDVDNTTLASATVQITGNYANGQDVLSFTNTATITGNFNAVTGTLTLTGIDTLANYQTALRSVRYNNTSDNPSTSTRTVSWSVNDGALPSTAATSTINITAINDAPTVAVNTGITVEEGSTNNTITNAMLRVDDVDNTAAQIVFTIGTAPANGTLKKLGVGLAAGGTFTQDDINNNRITYDHNGSQTTSDSFTFTVSDGAGGTIGLTTFNITIGEVDNSPTITAGGTLNYNENDPATAIDTTIVVNDVDSANLVSATVQITGNYVNGQDLLSFTNTANITGSFNAGTGTLTLTGTDTVANYQAALRSVKYNNTSENPSTSTRTVSWSVNDGNSSSTTATSTINVTAVNDGPVNTVPGAQGTAQNTPLVFSSGTGNQISVADVDAGANNIQVTLTAANGTLTLSTTSGLSFSFSDGNGTGAGDGTADATMTFRGTLASVNAALNGMTFTPAVGFSGAAMLTITSNDLGNTGTGGPLSDTDMVNIQVALNVSISNSQVTEPSSGTIDMVFVVALNAPAPAGGVSVSFTTQDEPPAISHAVAGQDYTLTSGTLNFAQGEQIKTIGVPIFSDNVINETNETFLVLLSNPVNATITNGTATGTILITKQPAGTILISEIRTSGPGGAGDDFVEIYNNSDTPHTVNDASGGYGLFKMGADCGATPVLIGVIPNGTVIPARGHYLFVGSAYSLANYGGTGAAAGDQTLTQDIENDRNVAIFSTASVANLSTSTRLDGVGFGTNTGATCDLLRESTTLVPLSGSTLEHSYFRDECGKKGNPAMFGLCPTGGFVQDTNVNSEDFIFVDTTGANTPAGQRLGAPGPQNLASGRVTLNIPALLLDATKGAPTAPNRVRDFGVVTNGSQGTLSVRRRFVNNTGANVTQLRFRIVDFSSLANTVGIADLRAITSTTITVNGIMDAATCAATGTPNTVPCSVTVFGTTVDEPPAQAKGGALNTTMGTILLPKPLAPGASANLQFLLGVEQTGSFKFFFNIEALP